MRAALSPAIQVNKALWEQARLYFHQARRELFLYSPSHAESIWVYQIDQKSWYRFSNIRADRFFEANGKLFFTFEDHIFDFDEEYYEDIDQTQTATEIVAFFQSHILEYGTSAPKRFSMLTLRADCDGGSICIRLAGNQIAMVERNISNTNPHDIVTCRLSSGRFQYAVLSISARGTARQTIHSLISEVR